MMSLQLTDYNLIKSVIGRVMHDPSLLENSDYRLEPSDFADILPRVVFMNLYNMKIMAKISDEEYDPVIVDSFINLHDVSKGIYIKNNGLEFLKQCYNKKFTGEFKDDYDRLKKNSVVRSLIKSNFDVSHFYKESPDSLKEEMTLMERYENATGAEIINHIEGRLLAIKEHFECGGSHSGNVAQGVKEMVAKFAIAPEIGENIEGDIFSSACRGARLGKFYLRSGSSGTGKTRLAVFDSCKICFPIKWNHIKNDFVEEYEYAEDGKLQVREPNKVLFITTEQDKEEMQTIILAYLSGVNETTIVTGKWNEEEKHRIDYANYIMDRYKDYYFLDEISDPNLTNVSNMIKKYVTLYGVKYVFYDYIFTSPSLVTQFGDAKIREDVALGMLANQLKQIGKDYNVFVSSSTQLNGDGVNKPGFKSEACLRGAKALADKADVGCIAQQINREEWTTELEQKYLTALNSGQFDTNTMIGKLVNAGKKEKAIPTHILDIYKMRRGRYKYVRIWYYIDLGTGERYDLFMTTADNSFINNLGEFDLFLDRIQPIKNNWHMIGKEFVNG